MAEKLTNNVAAEVRESFGKGAARKIRAVGKIPAVIYGHGTEPKHVTLPGHQVSLLIRKANAILDLDIAGEQQTVLVKDVQKDPVRQIIEHMDLIVLRKGERVAVDVAVHISGDAAPGTLVQLESTTLSIEALAISIPENVVVSVEGLEAGTLILAKDVVLPEGATLLTDEEILVVNVTEEVEQDLGDESDQEAAAAESAASAE